MKLQINITRQVIEDSAFCGYEVTLNRAIGSIKGPITLETTSMHNCAVAKAIVNLFPNALVGPNTILFMTNEEACRESLELFSTIENSFELTKVLTQRGRVLGFTELPEEAGTFISRFDDMSPQQRLDELGEFSFEIDVPDKVIDSIGIEEVRRILSTSTTLQEVLA